MKLLRQALEMHPTEVQGRITPQNFENSWSYTEEISKSDYYAVSVSGDIFNSDDSQVVTCKLIIDGKVKSEKSATGKYGSAYCSTL